MSLRAHRFTDPPTKLNRFAWAGAWIKHRRANTGGLLSRLARCVRSPIPPGAAAPAAPNVTNITTLDSVCPVTYDR